MATSDVRSKIPPGPENVPPALAAPTSAFKLHAWLATAAFIAFVVVYLGLTFWLGAMIYRFIRDGITGNLFVGLLQSFVPALLLFVLVRGIFAIKRGGDLKDLMEVRPENEPDLFAFLHDIADRVGAPRPHRVYLAPEVNAAVFYDLGFINFIFPTKKNLLIGVGLLNVLTLSELRAVLAHEFGHFAQRTTAIGSWVYLAEQIAAYIVSSRSKLDNALRTLSVQDPRIAWIGWILRLCVWAVRAVLDTMYLIVALSKRALSREMELQADLVAVSLTGSDALVHALHKTQSADQSMGSALATLRKELAAGFRVPDLYALQTRYAESFRRVTDDPMFGVAPPLPESNRAEHRVFKKLLAQPPKMWATHPPVREREDNAKQTYVPCALDDRSAWELFSDPQRTRNQVTELVIELILNPPPVPGQPATPPPQRPPTNPMTLEASLASVDAGFERSFNRPEYRGTYLGRPLTRIARTSGELFEAIAANPYTEQEFPALTALYPPAMREEIERWKQLHTEHLMLKGLLEGHLKQSDATTHYRGQPVRRFELPEMVKSVEAERDAAANTIAARDRHLRTLHQQLARRVGRGWAEYHESLVRLTHYAEHTSADILDANGHLNNVFAVVTADGRVSDAEFQRLLAAGHVAYESLARAYAQKNDVILPPNVLAKMNRAVVRKEQVVESWGARLGELQLYQPSNMNFGDWLANSQSWLGTVPMDFEALGDAAVEELLDVEEMLRGPMLSSVAWDAIPAAPAPARYPLHYATMEPGRERPRQLQLDWWDRFQLADGLVPATARAAVAVSMLGGLGFLSQLAISHTLYAYNGLNQRVTVSIGAQSRQINPGQSVKFELGAEDHVHVRTTTSYGQPIEEFDEDSSNGQSTYVYNVARAALLYNVTVTYGYGAEEMNERVRPTFIGNPRWSIDRSAGRFEHAPERVTLSRGQRSTTRVLLGAARIEADPLRLMEHTQLADNRAALVRAHLRFDPPRGTYRSWVRAAERHDRGSLAVLAERINESETSAISIMRMEQDVAEPSALQSVCARHRQWAQAHPGAAGAYVTARCLPDLAAKNQAFRDGLAQYPGDPYFSWAVAWQESRQGQWASALTHVEPVLNDPLLRDEAGMFAAQVTRVQWALGMLSRDGAPPLAMENAPVDRFVSMSDYLRETVERERGAGEGARSPVYALSRGELSAVPSRVTDPAQRTAFTQLVGASDGAPAWAVTEALRSDVDVHPSSAPWLVALSIREHGRVPESFAAVARSNAHGYEALVQWLLGQRSLAEGAQRPEPPAECDQPLALAMATIVLKERTPIQWRTIASAFFFVGQRPYFSRDGNVAPRGDVFGYGGLGVRAGTFGGTGAGGITGADEAQPLPTGNGRRGLRSRGR